MHAANHDTLRLTPSNTRTAILFVAMLAWTAIGVTRYTASGGLLMLGLAAVGLAGSVVYGLMLLPNSSYLEATPERLTISSAFRKRTYVWTQINSVYADSLLSKEVVKYEVSIPAEDGTDAAPHIREETLPDTYGLPAQELADQLDAYRRRARMAAPS